MSEKSTNNGVEETKNRNVVFFLLVLLIVVSFLIASLALMTLNFYSGNTLAKIVLITGFVFLGFIILMIVQTFIKKQIISQSKFPICHDMVDEYKLCARCIGFYVGFALFTVLLAMKTTIYMDFLRVIGVFPYFVVMFLILLSVPLHGSLRRLSIIKSNPLALHIIGFVFSSSLFLVGNFIIYLLYG